ncbi:MAG: flagellar protein FlgN [Gammaproteobacteria bacterium]|nr:flagellar protein FlgN [Gammaproteobacteria bacterium]
MAAPDPDNARQRLLEVVGNSIYHALGLKETLENERRALEQQDMDGLNSAVESKSLCISALRQLDDERSQLCVVSGFAAGTDQMQQMSDWCDDDDSVANAWQHLMEIAVECNALNITNGAIIQGRKLQIETSLSIIRGGVPQADTYNRGGADSHVPSQQALAEA